MPIIASRVLPAILTLTLLAAASSQAAAQWALTADAGAARFWGGSRESAGNRSFRPYRPTFLGIGVERAANRVGIDLRAYHAHASLALEAPTPSSSRKMRSRYMVRRQSSRLR